MRIALISDIHGNLEALTAVLRDIERHSIDEIACLGDIVGYGCDPSACLELVRTTCRVKLLGNHDAAVLGRTSTDGYNHTARISAVWTRSIINDRDIAVLSEFPLEHRFENTLLVHASPYQPDQWHYILSPSEATVAFENMSERLCFHGHSHIPTIYSEVPGDMPRRKAAHDFDPCEESRYLINVGSVGQPRDDDPRAGWVCFDTAHDHIDFHRIEYDISLTQSKMTQARMPEALVTRLAVGR